MSQPHARMELGEFRKAAPAASAALIALGQAAADSSLGKDLIELVKVRASQLNGCSFCTQYHLNLARQAGAPQAKLDLVAAWRDAGVFGPRERAALAWTESLTALGREGAPEAEWAELRAALGERDAVALTVAIANINAWNRIAVGLRFTPPAARLAEGAA